ncbi:putative ferrous iron permease [Corynebacterium kutscheri]|uniref:Ferrous iron permease n=1 Tax=Corynebacterium kutscheri TaxID=35755 RepID=A0AB38VRU5_9CORY|nr:FTR1 family protein [Corynebacterium kutscheri]VEH06276.1 putative ferrous iron permease [Corynebacterium kutscheri]VEH10300.1 putative ferrous iron permease [Corynebacterium kutscheri]VEH82190.1 putative ferrous iron permease [Corynebacterium kutscheri]
MLSLIAAAMLTWMIVWMSSHARQLAVNLRTQSEKALAQSRSGWPIIWIAIISVGREGLETAIFVWATVKATSSSGLWLPTLGVISGLLVAIIIGWLVYRGGAGINLRIFFNVTGFLLIFVAAGIVSYGIGDLQEAAVLPGWGITAYDYSAFFDGTIAGLHPDAWWFVLLEAMFNFNLSPTYLQVLGWVLYIGIMVPVFLYQLRKKES